MVSLARLQEVPPKNMMLLVGPHGSGKSTFCHRTVLNNLVTNRPFIFMTTDHAPSNVTRFLQEKGFGKTLSEILNFVDAFHETVGLSTCMLESLQNLKEAIETNLSA